MYKMDGKEFVRRIDFLLAVQSPAKNKGEFYEKSGISSASMSQYRTGAFNVTIRQIERAATYFGMSVDDFIGEKQKDPAPKSEAVSIEDILDGMTDDQLLKFINLATQKLMEGKK